MKRGIGYLTLFCICVILSAGQAKAFNISDLEWVKDVGARTKPDKTQQFNVEDYGAKPDGVTMNTVAIQKTIDACAQSGGGIVTFGRGKYLTGSVYLKEGVNFHIPKGTTILGSTDINDYPVIDTRVAGIEMKWPSALINILGQKNVLISGDGIVHGQGKVFWDKYWDMRKDYEKRGLRWIVDYDCDRPRTVLLSESSDITLEGLTFQQAGFWTIQLLYSSYCTVDGVVVQNNLGGHGPSTDGIDIDSSSHILVENCDIDCNDDNFCLKAGRDADGLRVNRPTEYVVIRNCISRAGGGLFTCGSETSGGIRYVLAHGLKAKGTNVGIRLKSAMNRGGTTEHIYIKDVEMESVGIVVEATMNWYPAYSYSTLPEGYDEKTVPAHWLKMLEKVDAEKGTPYFHDIYVSGLDIQKSNKFLSVEGSEKSVMRNFHFSDIKVNTEDPGKVEYAADWTIENVKIRTAENSEIQVKNSKNIFFANQNTFPKSDLNHSFKTVNESSKILSADYPEFGFNFPEMGGNLKFGIIVGNDSKWMNEVRSVGFKQQENQFQYTISDPLIKKGELVFKVTSLSEADGIIIEVENNNLPENTKLFWSYGGASGKLLDKPEDAVLQPSFCKNNVFSVEGGTFSLYYGQSMGLRMIRAITPPSSEIRLSDAFVQDSPLAFFESGKKTDAPALAAVLPLKNGQKEYFCLFRQNRKADYNYYMLSALFDKESKNL